MTGPGRRALAAVVILQVMGLWSAFPAWSASEEQLPATVAAVVDYQRVLQEAAASKSIATQMDVRRKAYHEEISAEEQRLVEAERELVKQSSVLSEEAASAKQKEFQAEVQAVRELTQKRRQQLDQMSAEAVGKVERAVFDVLTAIAEERGLNLVVPTSQVLFFSRQIDLTEEVLAQLDATLSEVPVADQID